MEDIEAWRIPFTKLWTWAGARTPAIHICGPSYSLGTLQLHLTPRQHKPNPCISPSHTAVSWLPQKGKRGAETRWEGHAPAGHRPA